MLKKRQQEKLSKVLNARRDELIESRRRINTSWKELGKREVEFEETAQKASLSEDMEKLDDYEQEELTAIERALSRIEAGTYGVCQACGKDISYRRLEIIPYADLCSRCAQKKEQKQEPAEPEVLSSTAEAAPPFDYADLSDDELEDAIQDALAGDGRVPLEELEITCRSGTVYLKGVLPSPRQHSILLQVLEDAMGFTDVVDHIRIDRQPWQRPDRTAREEEGKTEEEVMLEGEDVNEDTFQSTKSGTSVSPPGVMVPEKEE